MRLVADDEGSAIYGVKIPPGYRGWEMVGVAHEAGNLNDIRAIFGSSVTIKAFRGGTRRFLDDTIIARLAWQDVPSDENNAVFGRFQSFVPGPAANVQFMVKDIKSTPAPAAEVRSMVNSETPSPRATRRYSKRASLARRRRAPSVSGYPG